MIKRFQLVVIIERFSVIINDMVKRGALKSENKFSYSYLFYISVVGVDVPQVSGYFEYGRLSHVH